MDNYTEQLLEKIEQAYNIECDRREGIQVSWVEYALLETLRAALSRIENLETEISLLDGSNRRDMDY